MTVFVDASAIVAMIALEPEFRMFGERLDSHRIRRTSAIAIWEAVLAVSRINDVPLEAAETDILRFLEARGIDVMTIGADEASVALAAHARFGKRIHEAKLNMGDCFSYACARTAGATLLYKGDDFSKTDLA